VSPAEFREACAELGLYQAQFARLFQVSDRTARAWGNEGGEDTQWRPIPYAVATLLKCALKYPQVRRELGIPHERPPRSARAVKGQSAEA
jgi:hypothetical protein